MIKIQREGMYMNEINEKISEYEKRIEELKRRKEKIARSVKKGHALWQIEINNEDKEYMIELGREVGLAGDALNSFKYGGTGTLFVDIEISTGAYTVLCFTDGRNILFPDKCDHCKKGVLQRMNHQSNSLHLYCNLCGDEFTRSKPDWLE